MGPHTLFSFSGPSCRAARDLSTFLVAESLAITPAVHVWACLAYLACLGAHSGRARNRLAHWGHEKHWLGVLVGSSSQHIPCSRPRASSLITPSRGPRDLSWPFFLDHVPFSLCVVVVVSLVPLLFFPSFPFVPFFGRGLYLYLVHIPNSSAPVVAHHSFF